MEGDIVTHQQKALYHFYHKSCYELPHRHWTWFFWVKGAK